MYKLPKMQRTLKDGRTDTSNGKWFGRVWGIFTRIIAEYHGTNVILGKLRNAVESRNKKRNPWCSVTIRVSLQVERLSHRCQSFFTRITAEYHGTDIILRKSRNAVESRNKKINPWCSVTIRVSLQVDRLSHRYQSFFTQITAESHGPNVILGKLRNAVE